MIKNFAANMKKEALLAQKAKLLEDINYYEKRIDEFPKNNPSFYYDGNSSSDSEGDFPSLLNNGPSISDLRTKQTELKTCLQATQELTGVTILQAENNILVQDPVLEGEKPVSEVGCWREVTAECRIDLIPFSITFYTHQPSRKFAPTSFRGLQVVPVKAAHENELSKSVLSTVDKPSDAIEVLRSYAVAYRSRRTTLARLADKYATSLFMEPMEEGGFILKCANLEMAWKLDNKLSPLALFKHRMKFDLEYMDESNLEIVKEAHSELSDPSLTTDERTLLLAKIITTCLGVQAPTHELYESISDHESVKKMEKTTLDTDDDLDEPQPSKRKRDEEVMAPPKSLPKKAKPKGKENIDDNRKAMKHSNSQVESGNVKRAKTVTDLVRISEADDVQSENEAKKGPEKSNEKCNVVAAKDKDVAKGNEKQDKVVKNKDTVAKNDANVAKGDKKVLKKNEKVVATNSHGKKKVAEKVIDGAGSKNDDKHTKDSKETQDNGKADEINDKVTKNVKTTSKNVVKSNKDPKNTQGKENNDKINEKVTKNDKTSNNNNVKSKTKETVHEKAKNDINTDTNLPTKSVSDISKATNKNMKPQKQNVTSKNDAKPTGHVAGSKNEEKSAAKVKTKNLDQGMKDTETSEKPKKSNNIQNTKSSEETKPKTVKPSRASKDAKIDNDKKNVKANNAKNSEISTKVNKNKANDVNERPIMVASNPPVESSSGQKYDTKKDIVAIKTNSKKTLPKNIAKNLDKPKNQEKETKNQENKPNRPENKTENEPKNQENKTKPKNPENKLKNMENKTKVKPKPALKNPSHRNSITKFKKSLTLKPNLSNESGKISKIPQKKLSPAYAAVLQQNPIRMSPRMASKFKSPSDSNIQAKLFKPATHIPRLLKKPAPKSK